MTLLGICRPRIPQIKRPRVGALRGVLIVRRSGPDARTTGKGCVEERISKICPVLYRHTRLQHIEILGIEEAGPSKVRPE